MESISQKLKSFLPDHPAKIYPSVNRCIYCGSTENLSDEHIIPFGMGGQMVIPKASCKACSGLSSAFEGTCLRTMFGPLRMLYDLPSYRKKSRPKKLPLKVRIDSKDDWTKIDVEQTDYPFLVLFPIFQLPDLLSGKVTVDGRDAKTNKLWIRGASASQGFFSHMDTLIAKLGVHAVMPEAKAHVEEFCLMLAKIGHAYASAEIGCEKFEPLLTSALLRRDLSNRADFIGGLGRDEAPSSALHELSVHDHNNLVVVRIRLLAKLGTPTYYVVAGRRFL